MPAWKSVLTSEEAAATKIQDTDGDTKVETEQNADEDIVRITVGGTLMFYLPKTGNVLFYAPTGSYIGLGTVGTISSRIYSDRLSVEFLETHLLRAPNNSALLLASRSDTGGSYAVEIQTPDDEGVLQRHIYFTGGCAIPDCVDLIYPNMRPAGDGTRFFGSASGRWSDIYCVTLHEGDHAFCERECLKCGADFLIGDAVVYIVTHIDDETYAVPIHFECVQAPKLKRLISIPDMELVFDFVDGKVKKVLKPKREKVIIKQIRDGFRLDDTTGVFKRRKFIKHVKRRVGAEEIEEDVVVPEKTVTYAEAVEEIEDVKKKMKEVEIEI